MFQENGPQGQTTKPGARQSDPIMAYLIASQLLVIHAQLSTQHIPAAAPSEVVPVLIYEHDECLNANNTNMNVHVQKNPSQQ